MSEDTLEMDEQPPVINIEVKIKTNMHALCLFPTNFFPRVRVIKSLRLDHHYVQIFSIHQKMRNKIRALYKTNQQAQINKKRLP